MAVGEASVSPPFSDVNVSLINVTVMKRYNAIGVYHEIVIDIGQALIWIDNL